MIELENILNQLDYYTHIHSFEILDELLIPYLENASRASQINNTFDQGLLVKGMLDKEDLGSIAVVFHEKVELAAYLDLGYSKDEINAWTPARNSYREAHRIAEDWEFKLLQDVALAFYGVSIPKEYLILARPFLQEDGSTLDGTFGQILRFTYSPRLDRIQKGEPFNYLSFEKSHLDMSFELFEKSGSAYSEGWKSTVEDRFRRFIDKMNFSLNIRHDAQLYEQRKKQDEFNSSQYTFQIS